MTSFSTKLAVLSAVIALGCMTPGAARADIVRSSGGNPVLSSNGNCVIAEWEGSEDCPGALAQPQAVSMADQERIVYFDFNKSTLTPEAKHRLDHLAKKLHWMAKHDHVAASITIVGFADRIGKADYNQKLGMKRAEAVRAYLGKQGVKAKKIEVRSLGETVPRATCPADMKRPALIKCLREDRRVEVEVNGQ